MLEAIGVAFSKNGKYSEIPIVKTEKQIEQEKQDAFKRWVEEYNKRFKSGKL